MCVCVCVCGVASLLQCSCLCMLWCLCHVLNRKLCGVVLLLQCSCLCVLWRLCPAMPCIKQKSWPLRTNTWRQGVFMTLTTHSGNNGKLTLCFAQAWKQITVVFLLRAASLPTVCFFVPSRRPAEGGHTARACSLSWQINYWGVT